MRAVPWMPMWVPSSRSQSARAARAWCECREVLLAAAAACATARSGCEHGSGLLSLNACIWAPWHPAAALPLSWLGCCPHMMVACPPPAWLCRFECKSDGQYFMVQHVALEPTSGDVEDSAYTGPVRTSLERTRMATSPQPSALSCWLPTAACPSSHPSEAAGKGYPICVALMVMVVPCAGVRGVG